MLVLVDEALSIMTQNIEANGDITLEPAMLKEGEINNFRNSLRKDLTKEIEKDKYDPQRDGWYKGLIPLVRKSR